jgi:hypothetical protein
MRDSALGPDQMAAFGVEIAPRVLEHMPGDRALVGTKASRCRFERDDKGEKSV